MIAKALKQKLLASELNVVCDAQDFQFERSLFYNTTYHLGALGAELRTEALATCLRKRPIDFVAAEARYRGIISRAENARGHRQEPR